MKKISGLTVMLAVLLMLGSYAPAIGGKIPLDYQMSHTYHYDFLDYENYFPTGDGENIWDMQESDYLKGIFYIGYIQDTNTGDFFWSAVPGEEELTGIFDLHCTSVSYEFPDDPRAGDIHWEFEVEMLELWYEQDPTDDSRWRPSLDVVGATFDDARQRASTGISGNEEFYMALDESGIDDEGNAVTGYWYADYDPLANTFELWDGVYAIEHPTHGWGPHGIVSSETQGSPYWLDIDQAVQPGIMVDFTSHGEILFENTVGWDAKSTDPFHAHPTPEPATMLLLGSGLIGLGAFGRKKLRK